ncbi:MAG: NUDIX domain-containing protein [Candidatus Moraniibacteriota bacterium]
MKKRVAVIIGRFQVPTLHEGHRHIIDFARSHADALLILIGTTAALPSARNPLPYAVREHIVAEAYPDAVILETKDHPSNRIWSEDIDHIVAERFPDHEATLYGSRDSFIPYYEGALPCVFVPPADAPSGTEIRNALDPLHDDPIFRSGMIHAQTLRPPLSYQVVDIAVIRKEDASVLLGMKRSAEGKRCFIGGFVDPQDEDLESTALRELREEAGPVLCGDLRYVGSFRIPDHRYRDGDDKVMTALFVAEYHGGEPVAGDDLDEVEWINLVDLESVLVAGHLPLAKRLLSYLESER